MMRRLKSACGLPVCARDGPVGVLADVYFHDTLWLVRGLAVSAVARRIVIPLSSAASCSFDLSGIRLGITLDELTVLPRVESGSIRSGRNLAGYGIQALDGPAGRVNDVVVDDAGWWIPRLVVDTRGLLPGALHELPASAVTAIDSVHRRVRVRITRAQIGALPALIDPVRLALP